MLPLPLYLRGVGGWGQRPSRYLSIKLRCGGLGRPIQTLRERIGEEEEREKQEGKRRARGALARLTAPSLTSQRRASNPSSSTAHPLQLTAFRPLCTSTPPLTAPPILPPCPVPLHWAATARSAQRVGAQSAGENEHVCLCVERWGTWSHAYPPYSAFSLFFFFLLSLTWP